MRSSIENSDKLLNFLNDDTIINCNDSNYLKQNYTNLINNNDLNLKVEEVKKVNEKFYSEIEKSISCKSVDETRSNFTSYSKLIIRNDKKMWKKLKYNKNNKLSDFNVNHHQKTLWSKIEDYLLYKYYSINGNNWKFLSKFLNNKSEKQIKSHFLLQVKKKSKQIFPPVEINQLVALVVTEKTVNIDSILLQNEIEINENYFNYNELKQVLQFLKKKRKKEEITRRRKIYTYDESKHLKISSIERENCLKQEKITIKKPVKNDNKREEKNKTINELAKDLFKYKKPTSNLSEESFNNKLKQIKLEIEDFDLHSLISKNKSEEDKEAEIEKVNDNLSLNCLSDKNRSTKFNSLKSNISNIKSIPLSNFYHSSFSEEKQMGEKIINSLDKLNIMLLKLKNQIDSNTPFSQIII